jgi:hypothetical protein
MQLQLIQSKIFEIREHRVIMDFNLAELYDVETRTLKQAVRRNIERFPDDFMFELTKDEFNSLKDSMTYAPFAFTEQARCVHAFKCIKKQKSH